VRALVTGGAGFIGRHVISRLLDDDWDVHSVDVRPMEINFYPAGPAHLHVIQDSRDFFTSSASYFDFDLVVHAAAVIGGRAKIDGDPLATAVDLELDAAMFRWAACARPGRVVYLSSSAVYPVHLQEGNRADNPDGGRLLEVDNVTLTGGQPDQTYGWSKLVGEHLAGQLRRSGVFTTVVRPFSGYGADQDEDYPFRAFIERARRRADPFIVWGDGDQVRDLIHVDDVVGATLAAVEAGEDGPLNVCTGEETSLNDLAALVCDVAGYRPEVLHLLDSPTGVRHRVGDPTRMLKLYAPKHDLEADIREALA
jgi:nucleoside-diphosphate-sugar epimerase